jgi:hypothetical protein
LKNGNKGIDWELKILLESHKNAGEKSSKWKDEKMHISVYNRTMRACVPRAGARVALCSAENKKSFE